MTLSERIAAYQAAKAAQNGQTRADSVRKPGEPITVQLHRERRFRPKVFTPQA